MMMLVFAGCCEFVFVPVSGEWRATNQHTHSAGTTFLPKRNLPGTIVIIFIFSHLPLRWLK